MRNNMYGDGDGIVDFDLTLEMPSIDGDAEKVKPAFMSEKYDSGKEAPKGNLSIGQQKKEDIHYKHLNTDRATYGYFNVSTKGWMPPYNGKGFHAMDKAPWEKTPDFNRHRADNKHKLKHPRGKATLRGNIFVTPPNKQANNTSECRNSDAAMNNSTVKSHGEFLPTRKGSNVGLKVTTPLEHVNTKSVKKDIMFDLFKTPERVTSSIVPDMHSPTIYDRVTDIQLVTRLIWEKVISLEKDFRARACKCENESDVQIIQEPDTMKTKKRKTSVGQPLLLFGHYLQVDWSEQDKFDALMPSNYYKIKEFEDWYERKNLHTASPHVHLPIRMVAEASQDWFKPLWSSTGWLTDEHCDALINLLIINSRRSPSWYETGWTCVESLGWQAMTASNIELVKERILPYVDGSYPELGGLPWHLADNIYGIGHVVGDHWVMYEISIIGQTIRVYDSLSKSMQWETIEASFKNVRTNLAWLCEEGRVWERLKVDVEKRKVWDLVPAPHLPQQSNGSDCGIMAMKYLECKVSGRHLGFLEPERCGEYRMSYCAELYHLGVHCASGMDISIE